MSEKYELIRESQHGFEKSQTCLTKLLLFVNELTNVLDKGMSVDVISMDFQKTFEKVPHERL